MKKGFVFIILLAIMLMFSSFSWASGIDYLIVQSAEGNGHTARESSTDSADIVNYNPAGTVFLPKNGLYINLGNTFAFLKFKLEMIAAIGNSLENNPYESTKPALIIPNLFLVYKQTDWAVFGGFTIPGGGGSVDFKNGVPLFWKSFGQNLGSASGLPSGGILTNINITGANLDAFAVYMGVTIGGSYKINDQLSVSAGLRYIYSKKEATGGADVTFFDSTLGVVPLGNQVLDYKDTATGIGAIFGVHIKPFKEMNIGIRYEMKTKLEYEYTVAATDTISANMGITDGSKHRYDLPGLLAIGASYDILPKLTVFTSFIYYFTKGANADNAYDNYDNGYDLNMAFSYVLNPQIKFNLGIGYNNKGSNEKTISDLAIVLDELYYTIGTAWEVMPDLIINFGMAITTYKELSGDTIGTYAGAFEKFDRSVLSFGLGFEYRI